MNTLKKPASASGLMSHTLDVLEGWADGAKPWRAMSMIVLIGLVTTALACTTLWTADQRRDQRDFEALSHQVVAQMADRLSFRRWQLSHASERWAQGDAPPSMSGGGFEPGHVLSLRRASSAVNELMGWVHLAETSRGALHRFWQVEVAGLSMFDEPLLSPPLADTQGRLHWLLVHAAKAQTSAGDPQGWVVVVIDDATFLSSSVHVEGWRLKARLAVANEPLHSVMQFAAPLSPAHAEFGPTLVLEGEPLTGGWADVLMRHAGLLIAAVSGLLATLGTLSGFVMLISIEKRAQAMSRRSTMALQRSESRNRAVVDTAPDAIITVDDAARVLWCNQATVSIFGRTLEDLEGKPMWEVLPVLEGQVMADWFQNHGIANRVLSFETNGRRAEGTEFPIVVSASRAEIDHEAVNTFIVRDTTDTKWAERELLLRERALESSEDAVIITDMSLPGQPMIFANPAFERITGYAVHDVLGTNCRFLQRDDRDQIGIQTMRAAIAQGRPCQVVLRNYRKDGAMFWSELTISPVRDMEDKITHYVGIASDITDRMAAEQVLHLRTERLNAVFDLSPDGFVVLDKRGELSIVNPAFERMTGLNAGDLVGQSLAAFEERLMSLCSSVEHDEPTGRPSVAALLDGDAGLSRGPRELLHLHTPSPRTLLRRVRHGGHDNETVMYFRDITHELEVDRMKSEFLSMAAHELRTPMASIFGFTELLLKRKFDEARRQDMLSTIHRQASILINLVNELLDLARIESRRGKDFKRQRHVLQPLIESTAHALLVHNDDRKVKLTLPGAPIRVDVDADKLLLALTNVLSNAYKYSPQGGEIELDIVWRDREGRPECGIRVTDHGMGMAPEQLARVFERFFRADTSGNIPGTGLGMTIVKEIIDLHGGQVELSSQEGQGTTVILWLPVLTQDAPPASPADSSAAARTPA
jgi:PAS domain S-box-containing protein